MLSAGSKIFLRGVYGYANLTDRSTKNKKNMDAAAKQQIVDRVKQANNILVTVSSNPSVDQLAACIGLTLLLNRMDKHATAVFSGQVPSTLEFLQPEKTIETNTDSLRDFIISLDKNKADKLRYKVEDQVVRIYITPYKTSLTENDLVYSQGDYNVEVVIALGIAEKNHIDAAITAHGKILHDATVITLNAGQAKAQPLGQINWVEPSASSLSEMVVNISEAFGQNLIDNQMATAFLTGIVAETNRFSNAKTSPKVMTMSAQLMAAGANQQLIVSKLEPPKPKVQMYMPGQVAAKPVYEGKPEATPDDGTLKVQKQGNGAEVELNPQEIHIDAEGNLKTAADILPPAPAPAPTPAPEPRPAPPPAQPAEPSPGPSYMAQTAPAQPAVVAPAPAPATEASPHALLSPDQQSSYTDGAFTSNAQPEWADASANMSFDPLSASLPQAATPASTQPAAGASHVESARSAVQNALSGAPAPQIDMAALNIPTPAIQNSQPAPAPESTAKPAPPPFPPPITPVSGAVIPAENSQTLA